MKKLLTCLLLLPLLATATELKYPLEVTADGMVLTIHRPVIDRWTDSAVVEGWIPVEVTRGEQLWVGAVRGRANSTIDHDRRHVTLTDQEVLATNFSAPHVPAEVEALARRAVREEPQQVLLDELLQLLAEDFVLPQSDRWGGAFRNEPPRIVVSQQPQKLLLIDQQPLLAPISGTGLKRVVNTDWMLFYDDFSRAYFVLNGSAWQRSTLLASGAWQTVTDLPEDFAALAAWPQLQNALPARAPLAEPASLLVSLEATELIQLDGPPRLQEIEATGGLKVVSNSESDLFRWQDRWYFLTAGRWFSAAELEGPWRYVQTLPEAFSLIPASHGRAYVRQAVAGTSEHRAAYLEATLPRSRRVAADSRLAGTVGFVGAPRFEPIAGTELERAVNTPFAVLRHNNFYYLAYEAAWYRASTLAGPWQVALSVPEALFAIPPSDPLHYVTYLRPAGQAEGSGEARFSYTAGYDGMYVSNQRVVWGTGWSYPSWMGYPGGSPVYWRWPWTYGPAAWASPYFYGPAYFPPQTLELSSAPQTVGGGRPVAPANTARAGYDYAPLHATAAARQEAARQQAARDLYAAPDGVVYRREVEGWSRHEDGAWDTMAELQRQYGVEVPKTGQPEGRQRQAYRQNEDDIKRMERYYERRARSYGIYGNVYVRQ